MSTFCSKVDSSCPSRMEEELKRLKRSPQLYNYYLNRMNVLLENHDLILDQIDGIKSSSNAELDCKRELVIRNKEVFDLRSALSDMQLYLQKEREQVLSLSTENDLLRIQLLKYHKKVDKLLNIAKLQAETQGHPFLYSDADNIVKVQKKPICKYPANRNISNSSTQSGTSKNKSFCTKFNKSKTSLEEISSGDDTEEKFEIGALVIHWKEEKDLLHDQIMTLNEDRELKQMEGAVEVKQLQKQVSLLTERLHERETQLIGATHQAAKVGKELISKEMSWMKERNQVASSLEKLYEVIRHMPLEHVSSKSSKSIPRHIDVDMCMEQLTQRDNLMLWYYTQYKNMENQLQEETSQRKKMEIVYKSTVEKLKKWNKYLQRKLCEENQRRRFDMEGLLSSIKILGNKVEHVEKKVKKKLI